MEAPRGFESPRLRQAAPGSPSRGFVVLGVGCEGRTSGQGNEHDGEASACRSLPQRPPRRISQALHSEVRGVLPGPQGYIVITAGRNGSGGLGNPLIDPGRDWCRS